MVSSFVQLKSILWKNWLLKWAHFSGFIAELALPVIFMSLLIMIKGLTTVSDSPNVAYFCGNTFPWFYSETLSLDQLYDKQTPIGCLSKPPECTAHDYYKYSDSFQPLKPVDNSTFTAFSQYGFIPSAASSGNANAPFYGYTIADPSPFYNIHEKDFKLDNPSLPLCTILQKIRYQNTPAIVAIAPVSDDDNHLVATAQLLRQYLLEWCYTTGYNFQDTLVHFGTQKAVESYITDKHYDDSNYKFGKIAFSIILNSAEPSTAQWDYSIRTNYTSFWDEGDRTVACLYGHGCDFTYTIPSTKFSTQDLLKPQSSEFLYGYTYSGFATLQQAVDQFIFTVQKRVRDNANIMSDSSDSSNSGGVSGGSSSDGNSGGSVGDNSINSVSNGDSRSSGNSNSNSNNKRKIDTNTIQYTYDNLHYQYTDVNIHASVGLMPTQAYVTDDFQYIISSTLGIFYMLSYLYPVSRIIRALVLEKETRIKEGMKMMGLTDTVYNLSWLITTVLQMTFVSILITLVTAGSVFEYSNKVYVFIYFEAFSLAVINMCFLLSTLFSRSKSASLLGPMIFFASFFPYYAVNDDQFDASAKTATCILAPACFALGAEVFADYEGGLVGVQSSNVGLETSNFTYNACVGMLFFDAVLYGVLAWYLDNTLPSEFGTPLPLYFPFLPSYWCGGADSRASSSGSSNGSGDSMYERLLQMCGLGKQRRYSNVSADEGEGSGYATHSALHSNLLEGEEQQLIAGEGSIARKGEFIEPISADLAQQHTTQSCLSIRALRKVYSSAAGGSDRVAVDRLDMDLFKGQVTVLLGHNGAGKTTTISMLVGLATPTAGNAHFPGGLTIVNDMHTIRRNLGVCPQHDILFPELTVMQHLQIYASFKGVPSSEVTQSAAHMLAEVGLTEKAHSRSSTLSGGQKRKLSLGIALIGDSKVVILDEPTSGMDPYSRRSTWNIIQRNKKGRIILLTTHFMDEADLLGDRVAIMAHGKLQCLGSPLFLKNKFGVGYTLTVVKAQRSGGVDGSSNGVGSGGSLVRSVHNTTAELADPIEHHSLTNPSTNDSTNNNSTTFVEASRRLLALVQEYIPEAEPLSDVGAEQSFRLPFAASNVFVELFSVFDQYKQELCIAEYGISVTTLEEVFIRVGEMEQSINDITDGTTTAHNTSSESVDREELALALGAPLRTEPVHTTQSTHSILHTTHNAHSTHTHAHSSGHVHITLPPTPEGSEEESPRSPRPITTTTTTTTDLNTSTINNANTTNSTSTAPHGILVDPHSHHSRSRSVSVSSDHGYNSMHTKRVSFRDSVTDSVDGTSGVSGSSEKFDARAAARMSPPPVKEEHGLSIKRVVSADTTHSYSTHSPPPNYTSSHNNNSTTHNTHTHTTHTHNDPHKQDRINTASGAVHTGSLFGTHFSALLTKRAIYAKRDRRMIFCQLVLPVLLVVLGVTILLIKPNLDQPNLTLSGGKYNTGLSAEYRNFIPFSVDGADLLSFPVAMRSRFNGDTGSSVGSSIDSSSGVDSSVGGDSDSSGEWNVVSTSDSSLSVTDSSVSDGSINSVSARVGGVYGTAVHVVDLGGADSFEGCASGATVLNDVSQYVLKSAGTKAVSNEKGSTRYAAITIAHNTNATHLNYNVMVNGSAIHGVGTYINLIHTAYLQVVTATPTASITVHNYPLPETYKQKNNAATADAFVVALFAMIAFCFVPASFAVFVVKEREVKAKHQQVISGVSIYAYWLSTYLWDIVSYIPTAGCVVVVMYIYGVGAYTKDKAGIAFILLFALYGPATAAITYLVSFLFSSHSTAQIVVMFFNFITGLCLVIVSFVLTTIPNTSHQALKLRYFFRIFPSFCLGDGILQLALCTDGTTCPTIGRGGYNFDGSQSPLAWDIAGGDLVCLCIHGVLYFVLAVVIEYGLTFPSLLSWLYAVEDDEADLQYLNTANSGTGGGGAEQRLLGSVETEDEDVAAERVRVLSGGADHEVVRIQQLRKIYPANSRAGGVDLFGSVRFLVRKIVRLCHYLYSVISGTSDNSSSSSSSVSGKKSSGAPAFKVAVQSLCFGIPKGQCFGFLGINGAGKTTTLSILSGEFPPTSGQAYIDGFSIRNDQTNIRRRIGYCPQFDALLELLTVREHLELYGRIKGFRGAGLEAIVRGKLVQLDLKDFEHKTAGSLSGGNKRKLSVAVATIGEPSIVFLDEPSTGMDPVARRFMWKVIARMTAEDAACSVILTTHSMEEAEALCSRIGVMVNGRLRCLGPAQHLKLRFGNGFEVNVKLALPTQSEVEVVVAEVVRVLRECDQPLLITNGTSTYTNTTSGFVDPETPAVMAVDTQHITRAQIVTVCERLQCAHRVPLLAPFQSGAMLQEALISSTTTNTTNNTNYTSNTNTNTSSVPLRLFLDWWLAEEAAERLHAFMSSEFNGRARLLERSTAHNFRYRVQLTICTTDTTDADKEDTNTSNTTTTANTITTNADIDATNTNTITTPANTTPANTNALSALFAAFETHKTALHIVEYSVGQTTLEQIFNQFAAHQDNPEVLGQQAAGATSSSSAVDKQ